MYKWKLAIILHVVACFHFRDLDDDFLAPLLGLQDLSPSTDLNLLSDPAGQLPIQTSTKTPANVQTVSQVTQNVDPNQFLNQPTQTQIPSSAAPTLDLQGGLKTVVGPSSTITSNQNLNVPTQVTVAGTAPPTYHLQGGFQPTVPLTSTINPNHLLNVGTETSLPLGMASSSQVQGGFELTLPQNVTVNPSQCVMSSTNLGIIATAAANAGVPGSSQPNSDVTSSNSLSLFASPAPLTDQTPLAYQQFADVKPSCQLNVQQVPSAHHFAATAPRYLALYICCANSCCVFGHELLQ